MACILFNNQKCMLQWWVSGWKKKRVTHTYSFVLPKSISEIFISFDPSKGKEILYNGIAFSHLKLYMSTYYRNATTVNASHCANQGKCEENMLKSIIFLHHSSYPFAYIHIRLGIPIIFSPYIPVCRPIQMKLLFQ